MSCIECQSRAQACMLDITNDCSAESLMQIRSRNVERMFPPILRLRPHHSLSVLSMATQAQYSQTPPGRWALRSSRPGCRKWRASRNQDCHSLRGPDPQPALQLSKNSVYQLSALLGLERHLTPDPRAVPPAPLIGSFPVNDVGLI